MSAFHRLALALAAAPLLLPTLAHASDSSFLKEAMQGDNTEVAMGKLAQTHGMTAAVRAYGRMLVHDHGAHRVKVAMLARAMGMHPTMALSPDGMQARDMMMAMHGAKFDAAFKQDMIEDHTKDIGMYEQEANSAESPKVKMLAQDTLPTLHKHLDAANAL